LNKTFLRSLLVVLLIGVAALACRKEKPTGEAGGATETIAPAQPQPDATGTGDLTQTVDIEDSRSEAEGGVLTSPNAPTTTGAAGTTTTTATTTTTTGTTPPTTTTR
jgi:hypothetical protein